MNEKVNDTEIKIENLWPYVALGLEVMNVADAMGRTKGAARYTKLMDILDEAMALSGASFDEAKLEVASLNDTEKALLFTKIKNKFDIVDDKLEVAIEESMQIIVDQFKIVERAKTVYRTLKPEEVKESV
jgi:hypothetical protein